MDNMKCGCGVMLSAERMHEYDLYPCLNCGCLYSVHNGQMCMYAPPAVTGVGGDRTATLRRSLLEIKALRSKQRAAMVLVEQLELRVKHEMCESRIILDGEKRRDVYLEVFGAWRK